MKEKNPNQLKLQFGEYKDTPARKWARHRNFSRFMIRGCISRLQHPFVRSALTSNEKIRCKLAIEYLQALDADWEQYYALSKLSFLERLEREEDIQL